MFLFTEYLQIFVSDKFVKKSELRQKMLLQKDSSFLIKNIWVYLNLIYHNLFQCLLI